MSHLANLITCLSLFSSFVSIILSLENSFTLASWAIILSVIFDGLDGQIARLNPISNDFGKELESLVDVISFGVAPCILGYIILSRWKEMYFIGGLVLLIYLLCSVIRLAKYNITPREKLTNYFYGLPTTVSGGMLASFILVYRKYNKLPEPIIFLSLILLLAFLMVSRTRYLNLDGLRLLFIRNKLIFLNFVLIISLIIAALFSPEVTIFTLFLMYLILAPLIARKITKD